MKTNKIIILSLLFITVLIIGSFLLTLNSFNSINYIASSNIENNNVNDMESSNVNNINGINGIHSSAIEGHKIVVTDKNNQKHNYIIKGVCYSRGEYSRLFSESYENDIGKLKSINANSIRTYNPLAIYDDNDNIDHDATTQMLDRFAEENISAIVGFGSAEIEGGDLNGKQVNKEFYKEYISKYANHPAILGWAFGNEYNYHYNEWFDSKEEWMNILSEAVKNTKEISPDKIVTTVHGEIPSEDELNEYNNLGIDIVMLNIYRGESFFDLFDSWKMRTSNIKEQPLVISEFGRSSKGSFGEDTSTSQANTIDKLWNEIISNSDISSGGYVFELNDESWKGEESNSIIIGSESHLGVFLDESGDPVKDAKESAKVLSKLWNGTL